MEYCSIYHTHYYIYARAHMNENNCKDTKFCGKTLKNSFFSNVHKGMKYLTVIKHL